MLASLPNATVVGQRSAATNGTSTQVRLPGGFAIKFTGMRLLNQDGSEFHEFHGIGIVPDIEVKPTAAEFARGEDPELAAAVLALKRGKPRERRGR